MVGLTASFVGLQTTAVRAASSYALPGTEIGLAKTIAKSLPGVGQIANGIAFGADLVTAVKDYNSCVTQMGY
ncbi:hypothetical protein AB4Y89_03615 [Terriglobus sp. 2YAB30_2]|uniref:hypothetical protein n=1 Tax=Terriglobus sp. 2YAB30_2 TaxID=3233023 RepID=UPI003F9B3E00